MRGTDFPQAEYDDIWVKLCEDEKYPCQYCKRSEECGQACDKWKGWYSDAWHKTTMTIALKEKQRKRAKLRIW